MKLTTALFLLICGLLPAQSVRFEQPSIASRAQTSVLGPYSTAVNFSTDLAGTPDTRPTTWGCAAAAINPIVFTPPIGYRVRILRVTGDFVYWPKTGSVAPGTSSEVGWGLKTTAPDGDSRVSNAFANTMVWIQGAALPGAPQSRITFDIDTHVGGLLGIDHTLLSQSFVAINLTGLELHLEPTALIVYQFEKESGAN